MQKEIRNELDSILKVDYFWKKLPLIKKNHQEECLEKVSAVLIASDICTICFFFAILLSFDVFETRGIDIGVLL